MALIKCSECGKEISDKATNCIHCGCLIEKKLICSECGKEINKNDKMCKNCGCPIISENNIKNSGNTIFSKIWLIVCIILCFLISGINFSDILGIYTPHIVLENLNISINIMGVLALLLGGVYGLLLITFSKKSLYLFLGINALILIYNIFNLNVIINLFYIILVIMNSLITFLVVRKQLKSEKLKIKQFLPLFITLTLSIILTFITSDNQNNYIDANIGNERNDNVAQIMIITDYINIRSNKSVNSIVLGQVHYGEIYTIISEDEGSYYNWYEIETANGLRGYIVGKYNDVPYTEELEIINNEENKEEITTTETNNNSNSSSQPNNSTNNNSTINNTTPTKVCDESAKQKLTNEYNTTVEQRTNEYNTNVNKVQQQIDFAKQALDTTGGYLSESDYNTQYQQATVQIEKEMLKNRYGMSVNYDKMVSTFNEMKNAFNNWKETYKQWYQEELSKIGC